MLTAQEHAAIWGRLYNLEPVSNEERSAVEVYEFAHNIPDKYFLYVKRDSAPYPGGKPGYGIATTWTGDKLGDVIFGTSFRSNFGDTRVPIRMRGINGRWYVGTYYESAGDYARVRLATQQPTVEA